MGLGFYVDQMLRGVGLTLELTAVGTAVSLVLGAILALGRMGGPAPARWAISGFVELVRGLPQILQLFILFFGLQQFGIFLSPVTAALIWLCLYGTGYGVEIFRAGFAGVHPGQGEAATALGLGRLAVLRRVVLPQAVAAMLPPLTNFVILQLKNTTLVYIIGAQEIMYHARIGAGNTERYLAIYAIAAAMYVVMNGIIARAAALWKRRMAWAR